MVMDTTKHRVTATQVNVIVIALCALSLVPLLAIGVYDRPSADDFSYSLQTREAFLATGGNPAAVLAAAVQTDIDFYNSWQGLYTSAFLLSLQTGIAGSRWYPVGCYLIVAFLIGCCLYLAYCIERRALGAGTSFWPAVGFALATLFLQCMPSPNEGIYWFNGAANYTPIFFAAFLAVGMCITALTVEGGHRRALALAGATAVSFIVSGGNYMPAFFNLMVMAGFAAIGFAKRRPLLALPLAAAIVGFAISALAPGTAIRQSALNELFGHPSVAGTLAHSAYQAVMDLRTFVDLPVLVFLAALTPVVVAWARGSAARFSWRTFAIAAVAACVLMVGSLCVPYYAMGGFGEGRARDVAFFIDVSLVAMLYGYAVCCWTSRNEARGKEAFAPFAHLNAAVVAVVSAVAVGSLVLFGSQLVGHGTSLVALRDLVNGEAAAYAAEYDAREAVMLGNVGGNATIAPLETHPQLLFYSDIARNEDDWSWAIIDYYDLEDLEVVNDGSETQAID